MPGGLKILIQLSEWDVDEKRRALGELLGLCQALEDQAAELEHELAREQAAAAGDAQALLHYGTYAQSVIERRARIAESIRRMEGEIFEAREILAEAHRELKKYEIGEQMRVKREAAELARREQIVMDEIGLQSHRRKQAKV